MDHELQRAYFVRFPRRIDDLLGPHPMQWEIPFQIQKTISLAHIDYENFVTDMIADRWFLEAYHELCSFLPPFQCLFVHAHGVNDGILVVPDRKCYVGYAAYWNGYDC